MGPKTLNDKTYSNLSAKCLSWNQNDFMDLKIAENKKSDG